MKRRRRTLSFSQRCRIAKEIREREALARQQMMTRRVARHKRMLVFLTGLAVALLVIAAKL
jgi:hypothetical protein